MPDDYHVLVRKGDGTAEVAELIREIGSEAKAGLHRCFYVTRAQQTVVMVTEPDAELARRLAGRKGWSAPADTN